jgi:hypothetical protein
VRWPVDGGGPSEAAVRRLLVKMGGTESRSSSIWGCRWFGRCLS